MILPERSQSKISNTSNIVDDKSHICVCLSVSPALERRHVRDFETVERISSDNSFTLSLWEPNHL